MTRKLTRSEVVALEVLMDLTSPEAILRAIAEIAGEKAEHVRATWNDETLAKRWEAVLVIADKARTQVGDIKLF